MGRVFECFRGDSSRTLKWRRRASTDTAALVTERAQSRVHSDGVEISRCVCACSCVSVCMACCSIQNNTPPARPGTLGVTLHMNGSSGCHGNGRLSRTDGLFRPALAFLHFFSFFPPFPRHCLAKEPENSQRATDSASLFKWF